MGISLQQYRAAIGKWQARRKKTTSEQSLSQNIAQTDLCTINRKEELYQIGQQNQLWKLSVALLCELVIILTLVSINSQNQYTSGVADTRNISHPASITAIANLDFTAATGNLISLQCQKALLVMAGVEPNPGPGAGTEAEAEAKIKE